MKIRRRVRYRAEFVTEIEFNVDPDEWYREGEYYGATFEEFIENLVEDAYCDIDIPENSSSKYSECSFEVLETEELQVPPLEQLARQADGKAQQETRAGPST